MPNRFVIERGTADFDLARCVASGQVFRWKSLQPDLWEGVDGDFWYLVRQLDTPVTGTLAREATRVSGEQPIQTRLEFPSYEIETNGTAEDFRQLFRLDWDTNWIHTELVKRGSEIEPYLYSTGGLRLMKPSCRRETLFSFLCSPNNHITRITAMVNHLAAMGSSFGRPTSRVEGTLDASNLKKFPDFATLAGMSEADLRRSGFGYRAATIPLVARELHTRGGDEYLDTLAKRSVSEIQIALRSLPGVGPKLTDCIALFALHRTETVPIDTHIWQALTRLYFPNWRNTPLTPKKYAFAKEFMLGRFGELAGWAQQCLFYDNVLHWRSRVEKSAE